MLCRLYCKQYWSVWLFGQDRFGCGYEPSELGSKLFGLDEWDVEDGNTIIDSCADDRL